MVRRRYRQLMREQKGAAMIVVLCILSVFLALALALLLASSTLMQTARRGVEDVRCRIEASTFADCIEDDLEDEDSSLNQYIRQQITEHVWEPGAAAVRVYEANPAGDASGGTSDNGPADKTNPAGDASGGTSDNGSAGKTNPAGDGSALSISMYWEPPAELGTADRDGSALYLTVACAEGQSDHQVQCEFALTCSGSGENEVWRWYRTRRG